MRLMGHLHYTKLTVAGNVVSVVPCLFIYTRLRFPTFQKNLITKMDEWESQDK